jgi:hypothetical protein
MAEGCCRVPLPTWSGCRAPFGRSLTLSALCITLSALCITPPSFCRMHSPLPWTTEPSSRRRCRSRYYTLPSPKSIVAPCSYPHTDPQCPFTDLSSASALLEAGHRCCMPPACMAGPPRHVSRPSAATSRSARGPWCSLTPQPSPPSPF